MVSRVQDRSSAQGRLGVVSNPCWALLLQGIDLVAGGRNKKVHRTAPKSDNVYLRLLVKVSLAYCAWPLLGSFLH